VPTQNKVPKWWIIAGITVGVVCLVHPASVLAYVYFAAVWSTVILLIEPTLFRSFLKAFLVTGCMAAIYVAAQSYFQPLTYGTTTPGGSQTDDSYFFSLVASAIPDGMETRPGYELSHATFSEILKAITPFPVHHPLDVLFFTSGIAGVLCIYARKLAVLITKDEQVGWRSYNLCLFCPLLFMNGGAVLVRDTFVAALFVMSLCALFTKRLFVLFGCVLLQFYLRPGTALILLPLFGLMMLPDALILLVNARLRNRLAACIVFGAVAAVVAVFFRQELTLLLENNNVNVATMSRSGLDEYISSGGHGAFAFIQSSPFPIRAILSVIFIWLVPFYHPNLFAENGGFDVRSFLVAVVYPIWIVVPNAWVVALLLSKPRLPLIGMILAFAFACFLIGMVSLESRHKTVVQPLFYILAASGARFAHPVALKIGYVTAIASLLAQIVYFHFH